jgi:hypothetical protein
MISGFFPEFFFTRITQGIEAGFTLFCQGGTTPVPVCHDGIPALVFRNQKTIAAFYFIVPEYKRNNVPAPFLDNYI